MIRSTQTIMYRLDNLNNEEQRISYQMSTGKKLQEGSDDANIYSREVYIDDKIKMYEGLKFQIEKTTAQNNSSDSTLGDAKDLIAYTKVEVIKALNATTDDTARLAIATNLEGVKQNLYMLANEEVEGEYLFAGSDSSVQAFSMDETTGKVTYNGDAFLRKVAVEDGEYRERGVNGFEAFFYTTSSAYKGETLDFSKNQRIVDQDGDEWKIETSTEVTSGALTFTAGQSVIDNNGTVWNINGSGELVNDQGDTIASGNISGTGTQADPYSINLPATTTSSGTISGFSTIQLIEYKPNGDASGETLTISGSSPDSFTVTTPNIDGTKFEAKENIFDTMDSIINALKKLDSNGNPIEDDVARAALQNGLDEIGEAYDGMNIAHGKLGGRNQVFEISLERVSAKVTQYNILSQEVGAADLTKVAVEAKALELTYTALYSTINKMNELSLVNFVK